LLWQAVNHHRYRTEIGGVFGTSSAFWMGLQADYDTEKAAISLSEIFSGIYRFERLAA